MLQSAIISISNVISPHEKHSNKTEPPPWSNGVNLPPEFSQLQALLSNSTSLTMPFNTLRFKKITAVTHKMVPRNKSAIQKQMAVYVFNLEIEDEKNDRNRS